MSPYSQLKSPFMTSASQPNLSRELDWKAEYLDIDGVLRRSSCVTRRMIQRGAWIKNALDLTVDEQAHTSIKARTLEKQNSRRATMQLGEDADHKRSANASLKYQAKFNKEKWLEDVNLRAAERVARQHQQHLQEVLECSDLVDLTENNSAVSPSRSNTYIDDEGNLRRRISAPTEAPQANQEGFVPAPATSAPPAPTTLDELHEIC
ncbi:hypothetical protein PR003_g15038 [Phytophthora rubi]|uniref:Uncharacterized protein n=1 Tax=Phytophthora rubi TaxID=129364 RepID=A0A6A3LJP4_9STRA|nr:hypothetical protein PR002_g14483 [Phytophthora rubi]KAE9018288.1 hypothetical protein PR001_g14185 [Phytophthora rubi]KAE9331395.1 hypothetical protein PR003_g15038 [Phytophthora rubi]